MRQSQIIVSCVLIILFVGIIGLLLKSEFSNHKPENAATETVKPTLPTAKAAGKSPSSRPRSSATTKYMAPRRLGKMKLSAEELKLIAQAKDSFKRHSHPEEKIEIIESLVGILHPKVVDVISMALDDKNSDVRMAAVELLEEFESDMIMPAVEKALDDKNTEIRETAINALMSVDSPDATNLLVRGVSDKASEVREVVFDIIEEKNPKIQEAVFEQAINSKHADVKERVMDLIVNIPSHNVMNILIEGMKSSDKEFREEVVGVIEFFVSEEFENYDDAKRWWNENKSNYDEELFEK